LSVAATSLPDPPSAIRKDLSRSTSSSVYLTWDKVPD